MIENIEFIKKLHPGGVFWMGAFGNTGPLSGGYYNSPESAVRDAMVLDQQPNVTAVYVSSQPVKEECLSRSNNTQILGCNPPRNEDISKLANLMLDMDPVRESGTSATDAQCQQAIEIKDRFHNDLSGSGFPEMMVLFSGNGVQMFGKLDLEKTDDNMKLIKGAVQTFSKHYAKESVKFDLGIYNPARLCRFPGTTNRKGDIHRKSKVLYIPASMRNIDPQWLWKIAAQSTPVPVEEIVIETASVCGILAADQKPRFNVTAFLSLYNIQVIKAAQHGDATLYVLASCLFNSNHGPGKAAIGQRADGTLFYICFHDSCNGHQWKDAKRMISGNDPLNQFFEGGKAGYEELAGTVVSMADLITIDFPPTIPLVENLIGIGGATIIYGSGGTGKSNLALLFALALASRDVNTFLDLKVVDHCRTLIVQAENAAADTKDRLLAMSKYPGLASGFDHVFFPTQNLSDIRVLDGDFNNDAFFTRIYEDIRTIGAGLLIIDPLISFHRGDENDNSSMRRFLDRLTLLMSLTGVAILLIHHVGRAANANGTHYAGRGASAVGDWAHNTFLLHPYDIKAGTLELSCQKARNFKKPDPIHMKLNQNLVFERVYPKGSFTTVFHNRIVSDALRSLGGKAKTQKILVDAIIASQPDLNKTKAHGMIKEAVDAGIILEISDHRAKTYELPLAQ